MPNMFQLLMVPEISSSRPSILLIVAYPTVGSPTGDRPKYVYVRYVHEVPQYLFGDPSSAPVMQVPAAH